MANTTQTKPSLDVVWRFATHNIERFSAIIASRPNYQPDLAEQPLVLARPACAWGCERCHLECAVAPERLAWWENELATACGTAQMGRA